MLVCQEIVGSLAEPHSLAARASGNHHCSHHLNAAALGVHPLTHEAVVLRPVQLDEDHGDDVDQLVLELGPGEIYHKALWSRCLLEVPGIGRFQCTDTI